MPATPAWSGTRARAARAGRRDSGLGGASLAVLALVATVSLAVLDRAMTGRLSQFFDLGFVLVCVLAALSVGRSGMFTIGVVPPLLMLAVIAAFTITDPATVTSQHLAFASTVLTGLAHHAAALVAGQGSALAILLTRGAAAGDDPVRSR